MRYIFLLAIAALSLTAFRGNDVAPAKQDPVVQFWTWFQLNEKRLRDYDRKPLEELQLQLQKITSGLGLVAQPERNGVRNVSFTAHGNEDIFHFVEEIVKKAPAIPGWRFLAFRQRMPAADAQNLVMEVGDINLEVPEMKFFPVVENDSLDVIIYAAGINDSNYMDVAYHCMQLLDNLLGEYDCAKKVRNYDFHAMPTKKEELADLRPLIALPAFVDSFAAGKRL